MTALAYLFASSYWTSSETGWKEELCGHIELTDITFMVSQLKTIEGQGGEKQSNSSIKTEVIFQEKTYTAHSNFLKLDRSWKSFVKSIYSFLACNDNAGS